MKQKIYSVFLPFAGCQHRCLFCDQPHITGARIPQPESLEKEILNNNEYYDELAFYGGSFTALPSAQMETYLTLGQRLIQHQKIGGIRISTRPDVIDPSILELLVDYGVTTVELGCQSFDNQVLQQNHRPHTAEQTIRAIREIRRFPLQLGLQLLPGLWGSTIESDQRSFEQALAYRPDCLRIYPLVIFAETALAQIYRQGKISLYSLDAILDLCAHFVRSAQQAQIPIIKLGLQVNEPETIIAGYYHSNFSQLVYSRIWKNIFFSLRLPAKNATLFVASNQVSNAIGFQRANLDFLERKYHRKIAIKADSTLRYFQYRFAAHA